jgi:hypothetical protein
MTGVVSPHTTNAPSWCSGFSGIRVPYGGTRTRGRSASPTHPGRTLGHTTP